MSRIYNIPNRKIDNFGRPIISTKSIIDFQYIIGHHINDIVSFDNGNQELIDSGAIILPRHYFLFVGTKDGEVQYKPYEYNSYRVIISTYKDIITSVDFIG